MESIIQKAIEGGYKEYISTIAGRYIKTVEETVLNPLFWQALGKACGWEGGRRDSENNVGVLGNSITNTQSVALLFHKINLTEGWSAAVNYLRYVCGVEK